MANITQVLIVSSADDPPLKPALIDRFLVTAGKGEVRGLVCINKCDLVDLAELQPILGLYSRLGVPIVPTSIRTGLGIDRLRELIRNESTVISGQSGVGKLVSYLNAIEPGLKLDTGEVSETSKKGKHRPRRPPVATRRRRLGSRCRHSPDGTVDVHHRRSGSLLRRLAVRLPVPVSELPAHRRRRASP